MTYYINPIWFYLDDTDYMNVCRAIQNKETTVDEIEEQFCIEYFDDYVRFRQM